MTDLPSEPTHEASPTTRKPPTGGEALVARREESIRLRNRGVTWQQIADQLGYDSASSAAQDMRRALDQRREELSLSLDQYREKQLASIDMMRKAVVGVLEAFHYTVNNGEIVTDADGKPLLDDAPILRAVDRLRALDEREARLLGLDAPVSATSTVVTYVIEGVDPADLT